MALAGPFRMGPPAAPPEEKVVYLSEELLFSSSLSRIQPTIEALLDRGYRLYRYTPTFAPISREEWQSLSSSPRDSLVDPGNHWPLFSALAQRYSQPQDSVWLFTSDQQRHFTGARPASRPANIHWIPVALEAPVAWLHSAARVGPDSLLLVLGQSTREATRYTRFRRVIPASSQPVRLDQGQQVQLQEKGDTLWAQLLDHPPNRVRVQNQPLLFSLFADEEQKTELPYLQASIRAITSYTGIPISLHQTTAAPDTAATLFFWLSSEDIPDPLLQQVRQQGKRLWVQQRKGPAAPPVSFALAGTTIPIYRAHSAPSEPGIVRWKTTAGEPLLTEQHEGLGKVYRFRSGFGSAWSQLGQSPLLPELLLPILLPPSSAAPYDAMALDEHQLHLPTRAVSPPERPGAQQHPLAFWFGLAALFLFIAERGLASQRKKK
ncbi:hypothetical protein BH24BAC1_BH24BAC1_04270 [soil metagenome]